MNIKLFNITRYEKNFSGNVGKKLFSGNTLFSEAKLIIPSVTTTDFITEAKWMIIVNESRYKQCGVSLHFSTKQDLLNKKYWEKIDVGTINWGKLFYGSAEHK